jgi:hypothetical protein
MRKLTHAALIAVGSVAGSMMLAGTLVTGCGSSSSGDDTSEDAGPDSTEPKIDSGTDAGRDSSLGSFDSGTGTGDSGEPTGDADSATEPGEGGDAGDTGTGTSDASDAGDTGTEAGDAGGSGPGDAGDSGAADAGDTGTKTGEGGDAGDTGAETDDASDSGAATSEGGQDSASEAAADGGDGAAEAGAGCTSTIAALADGGGVLVSGFDTADVEGWGANPYVPATGGAISYSATVGHTCPGAITLTVPFTSYGQGDVEAQYNYNPQAYPNWNGHTKLHYWVSIAFETGDAGVLLGAEAGAPYLGSIGTNFNYAQWGNYSAQDDNGNAVSVTLSSSSTQEWQEVVLDLSDDRQIADAGGFPMPVGTSCATGNACKLASVIGVGSSAPAGGPAAPTTTVLYIDDIWLE